MLPGLQRRAACLVCWAQEEGLPADVPVSVLLAWPGLCWLQFFFQTLLEELGAAVVGSDRIWLEPSGWQRESPFKLKPTQEVWLQASRPHRRPP